MRHGDFAIAEREASLKIRFAKSHYVKTCGFLYAVYAQLPETAVWQYDNPESLGRKVNETSNPAILWTSILDDLYALGLTLGWKAREATHWSVQALNSRALSSAAMTARGAFEAATAAIDHVARLQKVKSDLAASTSLSRQIEILSRFERTSVRGIWGRKGGLVTSETNANHFLDHQRSVLEYAKDAVAGPEIVAMHSVVYATLCSMAHPSADGHQVYWIPPAEHDVDVTWHIGLSSTPDLREPHSSAMLEVVLWALGWAATHSVRAVELLEEERTKEPFLRSSKTQRS